MFQQSPGKNYGKEIELVFGENEKLNFVRYHNNDLLAELIENSEPGPIQPSNYTFSYDLNGGNGTAPNTQSYAVGTQVTISSVVPTNTGFVFGGWSDGTTIYQAGQTFIMPSKNVTLRAQWVRTYTVSYDLNGGSGMVPSTQSYAPGTRVTITSSIPTRGNLVFESWTDGSTTYQPGQSFTMPTQNITLHARWSVATPGTCTVSYDLNGGSGMPPLTQTYATGAEVIITSYVPVRVGAKFEGWSDGSHTYQTGDKFIAPDHNIVLTAQWDLGFPDSIYDKQHSGTTCTLASSAMMLRRRAFLDGRSNWQSMTEEDVKKVAWVSYYSGGKLLWGLSSDFTYLNMRVITEGKSRGIPSMSIAQKKSFFISMLSDHPEGIVIYNHSPNHAILLTDYDHTTDTFYCVDPTRKNTVPIGRIELVSSTIPGNTQDSVISTIDQIWYIERNSNAKTITSQTFSTHCPVEMQITIDNLTLDSTNVVGTISNEYVTMTTSGIGQNRNVTVTVNGNYALDRNISIKLSGTDTGQMTFEAEYFYTDGTTETHSFKDVPITKVTTGSAIGFYPNSTVILTLTDKSDDNTVVWATDPNETATAPSTNFDNMVSSSDDSDIPSSSTSTSSGSDSNPSYSITIPNRVIGGTVKAVTTSANEGQRVTLTVTPDSGYELSKLIVTDGKENELKLTTKDNRTYTFTMPNSKVTVGAVFTKTWSNPFSDVSENSWHYDAVKFANKNGLMSGIGNGLFAPETNLTRAQFAQILYNKEGRPTVDAGSNFVDVASGTWYTSAVNWAAANSIVNGYGDGCFGPNDNITREQLAVMLWRYAGSPTATNKELNFTDADKASGYALDALCWAVENDIINGYGNGQLSPQGLATRAQVAQILKNYLEQR